MKNYKSASTERPPEWDTTSSPETVYHNYNVVEVPATEENPHMFEYEVDQYTRMEYLEHEAAKQEKLRAKLEEAMASNTEDITGVQLALAEIYEMIVNGGL